MAFDRLLFGSPLIGFHGYAFAIFEPRNYLMIGLALIAVGSGGIKPCVSAHVGDQFGKSNAHLMEKIFGWFYLSINFGCLHINASYALASQQSKVRSGLGIWDSRCFDGSRNRVLLDGP